MSSPKYGRQVGGYGKSISVFPGTSYQQRSRYLLAMAKGSSAKSKKSDKPKLGRPPASSSAETRGRIVDVARRCFAEQGFEATTNRSLAKEAGITTGAIYHYFESKLDIFQAVDTEVQTRVYIRFRAAERSADTFVGKLEAVLETAHDLNREDPTLAQFLGASRIDRKRVAELKDVPSHDAQNRTDFFEAMVDFGVKNGEIKAADKQQVLALIRTVTVGLTDAVSSDLTWHRHAIDALKALLEGRLVHPPR